MTIDMRHLGFVLAVLLAASGSTQAGPASIVYEAVELGGGQWEYTYEVSNNSLPVAIEEFTIWFELGSFAQLAVTTPDPPAGDWDELVVQPDPVLTDDGFYDALALSAGIAPGETVADFSVSFGWLGSGQPGAQLFEIIDPETFEPIYSGLTTPEPTTLAMLIAASICCGRRHRR